MNKPQGPLSRLDPEAAVMGPEPDYLRKTYTWAYLNPRHLPFLDRGVVVSAILWGNANRLMEAAFQEFQPGDDVLQPAAVYGPFSKRLAKRLGADGRLEVRDVAPVQIAFTQRKMAGIPGVTVRQGNAADPVGRQVDGVCCFFLLHEVPDDWKRRIIGSLLDAVRPGGKAVFVDYHQPAALHPLRPIMSGVFHWLEPYALGMMGKEIQEFTDRAGAFTWRKETYFGGLYQKVVAERAA
ncbi:rhodoquinone biosynthesis methyltransferase RquA [Rhodospirillum sp. A1_3_36]|uniref:rhodoquinone biosynthesis methyltransferase RquA n=1 Tax=Rhodospirillum sp. A1_3_36 TaxID=3391666 RepID=UPI0039A6B624